MKKITLFALFFLSGLSMQAQVSFEAARNFGKLQNVTYDAFIPNKLYAATQGNHIVVSTDNGQNWTLLYSAESSNFIEDLKPALSNTALSFSTRDAIHVLNLATNTITASVPVPQSGVDGAGPSYVTSYTIFKSDTNVMLVDTGFGVGFSSFGKTFYTTNGGADWTEIYYTVDHDNVFINNVAISPDNSQVLYLARGNGDSNIDGGIWKSTNAGADFTETLTGVTLDAIAFNPTDADDMLLGSSIGFGIHPENLYRSADGGNTWSEIHVGWTDETLNNITTIAFHPTNPQRIMLLEENEIVSSDDGGATWDVTVYPVGISMDYYYGLNVSFNPFDAAQVAVSTDLFPQFTNDGGATLTQIQAPFYNVISTSLARENGVTHLYYGSNGGRLHRDMTTVVTDVYDAELPNSFNPKRNYMVADSTVPGRVFTYASMGFFGGWLNMSTDYGATKVDLLQSFADDMQELTVDPNNSNIIYVSMRSGEGGSMFKIDFSDLNNIVSTEIITPEVSEFGEGVVTGIQIKSTDSNEIYIAKRTQVFKSVDGGATWEEKSSGLQGIVSGSDLIWDMTKNPLNENQLTLTSNVGIYTTTDSAENWTVIYPNLDIKRVEHSPLNDGVIVGTVHSTEFLNAQIVYSIDNGENWETVTPETLKYVQSYSVDYDYVGNSIHAYLATTDLGMMKYEINDLPLAVKNPTQQQSFGIYPNPAANRIQISGNQPIDSVSIFSITGQKVLESRSSIIDVSQINSGVYLVKATFANGTSATEKLVKQ